MADTRAARPSTDEETAPLLQDVSHPDGSPRQPESRTFTERIAIIAHEPLTPLTQILCVVALVFLLLSSVFIGLFAGAQHKLNTGKGGNGELPPAQTVTVTLTTTSTVMRTATDSATRTVTSTATSTATTSATRTATSTTTDMRTSTSTVVSTSTVSVPAPIPTGHPEKPEETCFTPQCIMLASSVLSSIDRTYDPCEDFYDFANGGWLRANPIPSDKGSFGNFEALAQQNRRLIQHILSADSSSVSSAASLENVDDPYDEKIRKKLRGLYASCMNEDLLNARGVDPLSRVVRTVRELFHGESTGVQPPQHTDADKDKKERDGLTAAVAYLHSRGIGALFSIDIEGDVGEDPNLMSLWFSQPSLGLPSKEYYEEESITDLYKDVLERLLIALADNEDALAKDAPSSSPVLAVHEERLRVWPPWPWPPWDGDGDDGGNDDPDQPKNRTKQAHILAKQIVKFEKKLADASLDLDILYQDPIATYNPVPFANLTSDLPQISFTAYLSTFAPRNFPSQVILTSTTYPSSLSSILNETSRGTIQAYLETRAALALAGHLGTETEAWRAARALEERLRGIKPGAMGDRAEYCIGQVENAMGFAVGRYFAQEVFGGKSREKGTKVITDIVDTFKESLKELEWMDDKSAKAASQKADVIRVKVGFPLSPDTRDPHAIANYYDRVQVHEDTFFENMLSASMHDEVLRWSRLGKQRDSEAWEMYPSMVNAYFNPPANEIVFPAGILQPPFFSQDWPGYMSYGSFGHVAAHELTHAFDSAGRLYNQEGKLKQWWTNETSENFQILQNCIVEQFSSYTIDDGKGGKINVNGNLTSGENIGDTGLIQAYRAWQAQFDSSRKAGNEALLPGLNFTRDQLFFISFARAWAQNIKPESAVARVRTDPHSPNRYRVDGTVSNIPEFAKAFKCPANAKLNPPLEKRCLFW